MSKSMFTLFGQSRRAVARDVKIDVNTSRDPGPQLSEVEFDVSIDEANLVTSLPRKGASYHYPVLDIDVPAQLVPSTTPGHSHLYIDHAMSWADYQLLLTVLGRVGILESGYVDVSLKRGHTSVRLPWIRKKSAV